jgi:uncharacterized membrane protein YkvA (DUF1232 family)
MSKKSKEDILHNFTESVNENNIYEKVEDIKSGMDNIKLKVDPDFFDKIFQLFSLVSDAVQGRYKAPWLTIITIVGALLYVVSPIDAIPDFIPVLGWLDDISIVALILPGIQRDLTKYQEWKSNLCKKHEEV